MLPMTRGEEPAPVDSDGSVSADTRHAQMAEGLYHRYRDVVMSMDRRDSFIWDAMGTDAGDMNWMEGRGTPDE